MPQLFSVEPLLPRSRQGQRGISSIQPPYLDAGAARGSWRPNELAVATLTISISQLLINPTLNRVEMCSFFENFIFYFKFFF